MKIKDENRQQKLVIGNHFGGWVIKNKKKKLLNGFTKIMIGGSSIYQVITIPLLCLKEKE